MPAVDPRKFYNSASDFYDEMISFSSLINKRKEWFRTIVPKDIKKAADIGCGSGLDTIALSQLGLQVTGFDISERMITQAMKNAEANNVHPDFERSEIHRINTNYHDQFDLVTSLGNTLANVNPAKLPASLNKIKHLMTPGGIFVLQILNYQSILKHKERIVNIKTAGDNTFIRFYDFYPDHLDFNILSYETERPESRNIITTTIYPLMPSVLSRMLRETGFKKIKMFGSMKMDVFNKNESKDLIITAE